MQLLEKYRELIERDATEISWFWKFVQMFLYLLCAISGYACSVLFYVLKEQIFGGNCPLWATCILMSKEEIGPNDILNTYTSISNWWKYIITDYKYEIRCKMYLTTCFSSCMFGIIWFTFFYMCGKGGHGTSIYEAPWRIVVPALFFNFLFSIVSIFAHYNLEQGYKAFDKNITNIPSQIYNTYKVVADVSECEIIKIYMKTNHFYAYNMCNITSYLQIFSAVMVCSWIGGLAMLILRIIVINDFRILKIKIYEVKEE